MGCIGRCEYHPSRVNRQARYDKDGGNYWWCKNCTMGFSIGPRCPCCHQGMRAASRHSRNEGRIPIEKRANVIFLDIKVGFDRTFPVVIKR